MGAISIVRRGVATVLDRLDSAPEWVCPVCGFHGRFPSVWLSSGRRRYALCPNCNSLERHRILALVLTNIMGSLPADHRVLHFAAEASLSNLLKKGRNHHISADIKCDKGDISADITCLPFPDSSFHLVIAAHVLEHVRDDRKAMREIFRVMAPGGIALLPVPIVARDTVEYDKPNPVEDMHMRAPGLDWFARLRCVFDDVEILSSGDFPEIHQVWIRPGQAVLGLYKPNVERLTDYVPVCRKRA